MGSVISSVAGVKKPKVDEKDYQDPYSGELRTRLLGIIDNYIKDKGIDAVIPKENRPYEYLSDEERAQVQQRKEELAAGGQEDGPKQTVDGRYYYPTAPVASIAPAKPDAPQAAQAPAAENANETITPAGWTPQKYARAALAARLQAQSAGVDPTNLALTPPKALAEQNLAQQNQQYGDLMNYIRQGRRVRGF